MRAAGREDAVQKMRGVAGNIFSLSRAAVRQKRDHF